MQEQEETVVCDVSQEKLLEGCSAGIENIPTTSQADQAQVRSQSSPFTSNSVQLPPTQSHSAIPISIRMEIKSFRVKVGDTLNKMTELAKKRKEIDINIDKLRKNGEELDNEIKENKHRVFDQIEELKQFIENEQRRNEGDLQRLMEEEEQRQLDRQIVETKQLNEHMNDFNIEVRTNTEEMGPIIDSNEQKQQGEEMEKTEKKRARIKKTIVALGMFVACALCQSLY